MTTQTNFLNKVGYLNIKQYSFVFKQCNLFYATLLLLFCACSSYEEEKTIPQNNTVSIHLSVNGWKGISSDATTRAEDGMLYPIHILIAEEDNDDIAKVIKLTKVSHPLYGGLI